MCHRVVGRVTDLLFTCTAVGTVPCAGTQSAGSGHRSAPAVPPLLCHITAVTAQQPPDTSWEFPLPANPSPSPDSITQGWHSPRQGSWDHYSQCLVVVAMAGPTCPPVTVLSPAPSGPARPDPAIQGAQSSRPLPSPHQASPPPSHLPALPTLNNAQQCIPRGSVPAPSPPAGARPQCRVWAPRLPHRR